MKVYGVVVTRKKGMSIDVLISEDSERGRTFSKYNIWHKMQRTH